MAALGNLELGNRAVGSEPTAEACGSGGNRSVCPEVDLGTVVVAAAATVAYMPEGVPSSTSQTDPAI